MRALHWRAVCQISHGTRHAQNAVHGARAPAQLGSGGLQKLCGIGLQVQSIFQRLTLQRGVVVPLALLGALPCHQHAAAYGLRAFARGRVDNFMRRLGCYFNVQINAVEQRAAEFALIAADLVGRAAASTQGTAQIPARAGVHGCDKLKPRWKHRLPRCA